MGRIHLNPWLILIFVFKAVSGTATALLVKGSIEPDVITVPGNAKLLADVQFTQNLPSDLQLSLTLTKLEPIESEVPCFLGVLGSCDYDVRVFSIISLKIHNHN